MEKRKEAVSGLSAGSHAALRIADVATAIKKATEHMNFDIDSVERAAYEIICQCDIMRKFPEPEYTEPEQEEKETEK